MARLSRETAETSTYQNSSRGSGREFQIWVGSQAERRVTCRQPFGICVSMVLQAECIEHLLQLIVYGCFFFGQQFYFTNKFRQWPDRGCCSGGDIPGRRKIKIA